MEEKHVEERLETTEKTPKNEGETKEERLANIERKKLKNVEELVGNIEKSKEPRTDENSLEDEKPVEEKKSTKKKNLKKTEEKSSKLRIAVLSILGLITIISGFYYYNLVVKYKNISPRVIYQEEKREKEIIKENVTLYIPSETNETLVKKQLEIVVGDSEEERIKNIFSTLKSELKYNLKYTDEAGTVVETPFLMDEVQLLDVYFDGSDIYLNMNYHFRDNMKIISQEIFIIYSIVNTLTEDSRYKRVKFLINDREVEQLNFYKLSNFYERNLEI